MGGLGSWERLLCTRKSGLCLFYFFFFFFVLCIILSFLFFSVFLFHFSFFFFLSFLFFLSSFYLFFLIKKLKMDFFPLKNFLKYLARNLRNIFLPELEPKYPYFWNFDFCFPENARFWNFKLDFFHLKKFLFFSEIRWITFL